MCGAVGYTATRRVESGADDKAIDGEMRPALTPRTSVWRLETAEKIVELAKTAYLRYKEQSVEE